MASASKGDPHEVRDRGSSREAGFRRHPARGALGRSGERATSSFFSSRFNMGLARTWACAERGAFFGGPCKCGDFLVVSIALGFLRAGFPFDSVPQGWCSKNGRGRAGRNPGGVGFGASEMFTATICSWDSTVSQRSKVDRWIELSARCLRSIE